MSISPFDFFFNATGIGTNWNPSTLHRKLLFFTTNDYFSSDRQEMVVSYG